ncbi:DUF2306 domain-containing protein [Microbispora triticiradicis]|uniref:DUF2306 domain-containing protein n=1 Tax=Microbispora triticiradicis TaxID=2200763 RepID=A0ABX9LN00_9ACTN|nr:DUF2306 domain-containing protein [Microbispora triticiradicis]RGA05013.1 DUF2306 domain-containing protein [Microbispora triticiradicis]
MRRRTAWLMLIVAVVAASVLVYPYLGLDIDDSRLDVGDSLHYHVLVGHIATAAVALVLGPLQFMPQVRARRRIHRTIGRAYLLAGVLPSAAVTIPVALWSGRVVTQIGLTTAAVLWLVTGGLAYRAARRRDFVSHRNWMMRNYALTFLAVTSRVLVPLFLVTQIPFRGAGAVGELATSMIPIGQTLGWIVNLVVVEAVIRRRTRVPEARLDPVAR